MAEQTSAALKKNVMLAFSCVDISLQLDATRKGVHYFPFEEAAFLGDVLEARKIDYSLFHCWGYFDILEMMTFEDSDNFVELQKLTPYGNTYEHKYYLGHIISNSPDFTSIDKAVDVFPLVGVTFIKLKHKLFKNMKNGSYLKFFREFLPSQIESFLKNLSKEDKRLVQWFVIWTYGWEDCVLVTFSRSYDIIKKLIFKLRTSSFQNEDIKKLLENDGYEREIKGASLKHCCVFTSTLFAFWPDKKVLEDRRGKVLTNDEKQKLSESIFRKLGEKIEANDKLLVSDIKLRTRPGHVDWVLDKLQTKGYEQAGFFPGICTGRNDIHIRCGKGMTFPIFADKYAKYIVSVINTQGSPITRVETNFRAEGMKENNGWEECEGCNRQDIFLTRDIKPEDKELLFLLNEQKFSKNILITIQNMISWSRYLDADYFAEPLLKHFCHSMGDAFGSIREILKKLKELEASKMELIEQKATSDEIDKINRKINEKKSGVIIDLDFILDELPMALEDRFRGILPVGETSYSSRITYKGNMQKMLMIFDYFTNNIYSSVKMAYNKLIEGVGTTDNPAHGMIEIQDNPKITHCPFITYVANAHSPFTKPRPELLGIIGIQLSNLFAKNHIFCIFHEVGHHFWEGVFRKCYDGLLNEGEEKRNLENKPFYKFMSFFRISDNNCKSVEEFLADYFSLFFGFNGNISKWETATTGIFRDLTAGEAKLQKRINGLKCLVELVKTSQGNLTDDIERVSGDSNRNFSLLSFLRALESQMYKLKREGDKDSSAHFSNFYFFFIQNLITISKLYKEIPPMFPKGILEQFYDDNTNPVMLLQVLECVLKKPIREN